MEKQHVVDDLYPEHIVTRLRRAGWGRREHFEKAPTVTYVDRIPAAICDWLWLVST